MEEEEEEKRCRRRPVRASGIGHQEIANGARARLGLAVVLSGGRRIEVHRDFDTHTLERLVSVLERG